MLIRGDARTIPLRDGCVDCVVTSPPYYGLRDYGISNQLGLEPTPEAYVANLVAVFREVRRVLKPSGTVWLNLGDSYATKDLLGIPWRVAFALQADGWYLRSDIIWSKPNPMPESVTDRPTKAHEYMFLLAKQERYFYDAQSVKEQSVDPESLNGRHPRNAHKFMKFDPDGKARTRGGFDDIPAGKLYPLRNRRSVWTITTRPNSLTHFAMMPERLAHLCILAGCPLGGLVLDPFVGSGTVVAVAQRTGRHGVGLDLRYQDLAAERTAQRGFVFEHRGEGRRQGDTVPDTLDR